MTSSDRFPVPVRSAVKSNLTDWCIQNLSRRALNAFSNLIQKDQNIRLLATLSNVKKQHDLRNVKVYTFILLLLTIIMNKLSEHVHLLKL